MKKYPTKYYKHLASNNFGKDASASVLKQQFGRLLSLKKLACCIILASHAQVEAQELVTSIDFNDASIVDEISLKSDYDTGVQTSGDISFPTDIAKSGHGFKVDFLRYLRIPLDVVEQSNGSFTVKYDYYHISSKLNGTTAWNAHSFAIRDLSQGYGWSHGFRNLGNDFWSDSVVGISESGNHVKGDPAAIPDFDKESWHEYVLVFEDNRLTWYVDGIYAYYQEFQQSFTDWNYANTDIMIGARYAGGSITELDGEDRYLGTGGSNTREGSIKAVFDNVRIWDDALTAEQVALGVENLIEGDPIFEVSADYFTLPVDGGNVSVDITSNISWTVTGLPDWLSVNETSGDGSTTLNFVIENNASNVARSAQVMLNDIEINFVQATITDELVTDAVIYPNTGNQEIKYVFYDLKSVFRASLSDAAINNYFVTDGFNGIRINIWGTRDKPDTTNGRPAHPEPGVVLPEYYANDVAMIKKALEVNPDLIIFASKKLNGKYSFPEWVQDSSGVIPEQYVILLADYIEYMASVGIPTHILGLDNERLFNEGNITPERFQQIVDLLEELAVERGFPMPQIIGHEDYVPGYTNWMRDLAANDAVDRLDIFGTHYYPHDRNTNKVARLESDLAYAGDLPRWHSELHWNAKSDVDDILEVEDGFASLLDMTDKGFEGLMWWDYKRSNYRGVLMRHLTTNLIGYTPVLMDDHDGSDTLTDGKLHTRAYRNGNKMVVWILNINETNSFDDYSFKLNSGEVTSEVAYKQWIDGNATAVTGTANVQADNAFSLNINTQSVTMLTFDIATDEPVFSESWDSAQTATLSTNGDLNADNLWQYQVNSDASQVNIEPASSYFKQQLLSMGAHASNLDNAQLTAAMETSLDVDALPSVTLKAKAMFTALSTDQTPAIATSEVSVLNGSTSVGYSVVFNSDSEQPNIQVKVTGEDGVRTLTLAEITDLQVDYPYDVSLTFSKTAENQTNIAYNIYRNRILWQHGEVFVDTAVAQPLDSSMITSNAQANILIDDIQVLTAEQTVLGDWNNDGYVDIDDIRGLMRAISLNQEIDSRFDLNNDSTINRADVYVMKTLCSRTACARSL